MSKVTFKGKPVQVTGNLPAIDSTAPKFVLTSPELEDIGLDKFGTKKKILNIFISLDTGVCAASIHKFYEFCASQKNTVVLNISMDLPFAASRFCKAENIANCQTLSAFRSSSFPKDYGVLIADGPLKGLCARAVVVLDEHNKVLYSELVPEITQEPSYDNAMRALSQHAFK